MFANEVGNLVLISKNLLIPPQVRPGMLWKGISLCNTHSAESNQLLKPRSFVPTQLHSRTWWQFSSPGGKSSRHQWRGWCGGAPRGHRWAGYLTPHGSPCPESHCTPANHPPEATNIEEINQKKKKKIHWEIKPCFQQLTRKNFALFVS